MENYKSDIVILIAQPPQKSRKIPKITSNFALYKVTSNLASNLASNRASNRASNSTSNFTIAIKKARRRGYKVR